MTPSKIEPATFWLVAQCSNQLRLPRAPSVVYNAFNSVKLQFKSRKKIAKERGVKSLVMESQPRDIAVR
jgi:hypothetical protein